MTLKQPPLDQQGVCARRASDGVGRADLQESGVTIAKLDLENRASDFSAPGDRLALRSVFRGALEDVVGPRDRHFMERVIVRDLKLDEGDLPQAGDTGDIQCVDAVRPQRDKRDQHSPAEWLGNFRLTELPELSQLHNHALNPWRMPSSRCASVS